MAHNLLKDFYYSLFTDKSKYLTYTSGETNVILSAPHGGKIQPINIPKRRTGNRSADSYTRRLTQKIISGMNEKPYHIYADIHRNRVDLNRNLYEATDGNKIADEVWADWNHTLTKFTSEVTSKFGKGLYIDIHSHNKSNLFEIGYGLSVKNYLAILEGKNIRTKSTLHALKLGRSEFDSLFGSKSFTDTLQIYGYNVLVPRDDEDFLNGGRNITRYKSSSIGALQIECPIPVLRKNLDDVAFVLIEAIHLFRERFM